MNDYREFETKTGGRLDALDVTEDIEAVISGAGIREGTVLVFSPHTTCCVTVANGHDIVGEIAREMERLAPADAYYAHDDLDRRTENLVEDEPANGPAHIFHVFRGRTSQRIGVRGGRMDIGKGERVLFVELDSSRLRRYAIQVIGE